MPVRADEDFSDSSLISGGDRSGTASRHRLSTAGRLMVVHGLVIMTVLGVVLFRVVGDFTAHYRQSVARTLTDELTEFVTAANNRGSSPLGAFTTSYLRSHVLSSGHLLLIKLDGQPAEGTLGSSQLLRIPQVVAWLAHSPAATTTITTGVAKNMPSFLLLASPIRQGPIRKGFFLAAADLSSLATQRRQVLLLAGSEAAAALVVTLLSTYLLLRRVLRTVGRVTQAADEIARGDLERRLGDQGSGDEVGRLATTFDTMLGRISSAMASQRQLLSDVSHQLRTPLTVARGHLEVLDRGNCADPGEVHETLGVVVDELDHMRALVDRLLLLGRALEPDFIDAEPVDLRSFLADIAEGTRVLAERAWSLGLVPDLIVIIDAQKVRGALLNLIDNAVKATGPADSISLDASDLGGEVHLVVTDSGRGMTEAQLLVAFARFARPGAVDASGSGLGLAIVKAVAEGHGGRVSIDSQPGAGCRVAVVLPASRVLRDGQAEIDMS